MGLGFAEGTSGPGGGATSTSQGHSYGIFQKAIQRRNVIAAVAAARELPQLSLLDALELTMLIARKVRRSTRRKRRPSPRSATLAGQSECAAESSEIGRPSPQGFAALARPEPRTPSNAGTTSRWNGASPQGHMTGAERPQRVLPR